MLHALYGQTYAVLLPPPGQRAVVTSLALARGAVSALDNGASGAPVVSALAVTTTRDALLAPAAVRSSGPRPIAPEVVGGGLDPLDLDFATCAAGGAGVLRFGTGEDAVDISLASESRPLDAADGASPAAVTRRLVRIVGARRLEVEALVFPAPGPARCTDGAARDQPCQRDADCGGGLARCAVTSQASGCGAAQALLRPCCRRGV